MTEIYLISCLLTNEVKALSNLQFAEIPSIVKKNPKYSKWKKELKKKNSRATFKLIDLVDDKDADLIYQMYLDLFRGWNVPLLNFYQKKNRLSRVVRETSKIKKSQKKFLIDDLPDIHKILNSITKYFSEKQMPHNDKRFISEVLLYCGLNVSLRINSVALLHIEFIECKNRINQITQLNPRKHLEYMEQNMRRIHEMNVQNETSEKVFLRLSKYSMPRILSAINYVFAYFQHQIIFNNEVWSNAFDLRNYLIEARGYNRKSNVIERFHQIMSDKSKQLSPSEFNSMTNEIEALLGGI